MDITAIFSEILVSNIPYLALIVGMFVLLGLLPIALKPFGPKFQRASLLNKSELRVYHALLQQLPTAYTVMCQTSYGEFLRNKSYRKFMTINARRADLVIVDADLSVTAVIEYQGTGHLGFNTKSRRKAEKGDKIKRRALAQAGIPLIEVPAKFNAQTIRKLLEEHEFVTPQPHPLPTHEAPPQIHP